MNELFEKTRDHILYVCSNLECRVSTFIGEVNCPVCEEAGGVARHPYNGRGAPGWTGRVEDE
jgi:hypothetical protein